MQVGDLVLLKHDQHKVLGLIIMERFDHQRRNFMYLVGWADELCDSIWIDPWDLEVVCK